MLRRICNYFRACVCKHEYEKIADTHVQYSTMMGTEIHTRRLVYCCKKCGYVQKVDIM